MTTINSSRRKFMATAGAVAATPAASLLANLAAMSHAAASQCPVNGDASYKALVCVYLAGGNDPFNTFVYKPTQTTASVPSAKSNWDVYVEKRTSIHIGSGNVSSLDTVESSWPIGLNDKLSNLATMFKTDKRLAIVANVGPLVSRVTKADMRDLSKQPPRLYSHNDQTSVWLTGGLEGDRGGWGGGLAQNAFNGGAAVFDSLEEGDIAREFASIAVDRSSAYCSYGIHKGYSANSLSGAERPIPEGFGNMRTSMDTHSLLLNPLTHDNKGFTAMPAPSTSTHVLEMDYCNALKQAQVAWSQLRGNPVSPNLQICGATPGEPLMKQLAMVANYIRSNNNIGVSRQVFFVQLNGFDTHSGLPGAHNDLIGYLNAALSFFDTELGGLRDQVTTFTASEFGRKLLQNGDGSDHAWGSHHMVMGGKVDGGKIYGRVPDITIDDTGNFTDSQVAPDGTLVPEISVDQFAWELAEWFGVPVSARSELFPNYFEPTYSIKFMKSGV